MNSGVQELIMFLKEAGSSIKTPVVVLNEDSIILKYNYGEEKEFKRNGESLKDIILELDGGLSDNFEDCDCIITALSFAGSRDTENEGIRFIVIDAGFSFLLGFTSIVEEERDWIYEFCTRFVQGSLYNEETKNSQDIIEFINKIREVWNERFQNMEESIQSHM